MAKAKSRKQPRIRDESPSASVVGNPHGPRWTRNELITALSRIVDELDGCFDPDSGEEDSIATAYGIALAYSETPMDEAGEPDLEIVPEQPQQEGG